MASEAVSNATWKAVSTLEWKKVHVMTVSKQLCALKTVYWPWSHAAALLHTCTADATHLVPLHFLVVDEHLYL